MQTVVPTNVPSYAIRLCQHKCDWVDIHPTVIRNAGKVNDSQFYQIKKRRSSYVGIKYMIINCVINNQSIWIKQPMIVKCCGIFIMWSYKKCILLWVFYSQFRFIYAATSKASDNEGRCYICNLHPNWIWFCLQLIYCPPSPTNSSDDTVDIVTIASNLNVDRFILLFISIGVHRLCGHYTLRYHCCSGKICDAKYTVVLINSLWPSDDIWRQRGGSTLAQLIACSLAGPSHYVNQMLTYP